MKYIRTKDGVYEVEKPNAENDYRVETCEYILTTIGYLPYKKDIIAQADTIEELCDEAVFFDNDNVPHYKSKEGELWYLGASLFSTSLRFAIWTDKGLIYVAKLNDKGELELI